MRLCKDSYEGMPESESRYSHKEAWSKGGKVGRKADGDVEESRLFWCQEHWIKWESDDSDGLGMVGRKSP